MLEPTIVAVSKAVESVFTFLATPEGQKACERFREHDDRFRADVAALWNGLFKR